ncbi:MAG: hypothetical protein EOS41_21165 [Mesorhizobium sp.]|uniref:hypothetical protein n=1 Tax=Mesorhizobium sp. TaxID=1871066 RepID=UPI000FE7AA1F|nr:hypothetical protein [Mesorhizobium sp.]RWE23422.1 MAG: hypothetical protein EOS41_21165 [Mesorhizobium sp.]
MESDDDFCLETVSVAGFDGDATELAQRLNAIVQELRIIDPDRPLDFRRMRRLFISSRYGETLDELSADTISGRSIGYTDEEYARGVAKVLILPVKDGGFEIVPVLAAEPFAILGSDFASLGADDKTWYGAVLHMLHHELCHVHDDNKKLDAMPATMLGKGWAGAEMFIGPLAEVSWCEYFANRVSSFTAPADQVTDTAQMFQDALQRTKPLINDHVLAYRTNADLKGLMALFQRHGDFLVKSAAYMLGYLDGIEMSLEEVSADAHLALTESGFLPIWERMQETLRTMFAQHPKGWDDSLAIYADLLAIMLDFYDEMGLVLQAQPDGGLYVDVPFRPENSTPDMILQNAALRMLGIR